MTFKSLAAASALLALAGCNTVAGIGKDLVAVGDVLTGASEDAQKNPNTDADRELCGGPGRNQPGC
ncbi:MAG: hypothetical protein R3C52_14640 [Hyphomonadaceae bacterium]